MKVDVSDELMEEKSFLINELCLLLPPGPTIPPFCFPWSSCAAGEDGPDRSNRSCPPSLCLCLSSVSWGRGKRWTLSGPWALHLVIYAFWSFVFFFHLHVKLVLCPRIFSVVVLQLFFFTSFGKLRTEIMDWSWRSDGFDERLSAWGHVDVHVSVVWFVPLSVLGGWSFSDWRHVGCRGGS